MKFSSSWKSATWVHFLKACSSYWLYHIFHKRIAPFHFRPTILEACISQTSLYPGCNESYAITGLVGNGLSTQVLSLGTCENMTTVLITHQIINKRHWEVKFGFWQTCASGVSVAIFSPKLCSTWAEFFLPFFFQFHTTSIMLCHKQDTWGYVLHIIDYFPHFILNPTGHCY